MRQETFTREYSRMIKWIPLAAIMKTKLKNSMLGNTSTTRSMGKASSSSQSDRIKVDSSLSNSIMKDYLKLEKLRDKDRSSTSLLISLR